MAFRLAENRLLAILLRSCDSSGPLDRQTSERQNKRNKNVVGDYSSRDRLKINLVHITVK